jgi:hypothetical protein
VGQCAAATGVKFWPGSPSILGERVTSGLVWRFSTLDCVSDNLACFKDGFSDSGSFLDVSGHRFYIAKPFPEEVTDILDPLSDGGSSCGESCDFGAMVKVMALGDEEGGDSPHSVRPPLERLPLQEQNAPLPEQDTSNIAIMDLRAPLDHVIDSAQAAEALEQTRLVHLGRAAEEETVRRRMSTTLREFYDAHGDALNELVRGQQRGHGIVAAGPSQVQRSPSTSLGYGGRGQGDHAPSSNTRGCHAQQAGRAGRPCPIQAPTLGLEPQARQPALHIHLWLDHMKTLPKGLASSKRAATDQRGPGAASGGQGRKKGKYTLNAALDQPCKFHSTPGREATHSTH